MPSQITIEEKIVAINTAKKKTTSSLKPIMYDKAYPMYINNTAKGSANIIKTSTGITIENITLKKAEKTKLPLTDRRFNQCLPSKFNFLPRKKNIAADPTVCTITLPAQIQRLSNQA